MRITLLAVCTALLAAGCATTTSHSTVARHTLTPAAETFTSSAPAPSPSPSPSCDLTAWAPGAAADLGKVGGDLQSVGDALSAGDLATAGTRGLRLAKDAAASERPRPPRCAARLRSAWRRVMLWWGLAGLSVAAGVARPQFADHDFALASENIKRANRLLAYACMSEGDEVHIISAIGRSRIGTIRAEVDELLMPCTAVHEVIFTHPRQSPMLKLAKCQELGITAFYDDRDDVCALLAAHGILAFRVMGDRGGDIGAERV